MPCRRRNPVLRMASAGLSRSFLLRFDKQHRRDQLVSPFRLAMQRPMDVAYMHPTALRSSQIINHHSYGPDSLFSGRLSLPLMQFSVLCLIGRIEHTMGIIIQDENFTFCITLHVHILSFNGSLSDLFRNSFNCISLYCNATVLKSPVSELRRTILKDL